MTNHTTRTPVICLLGATASGKTDLAVELVQRHPFEIISVDSAQIFKQMDIGTGKPDAAILAKAPHRLIDIRDPAQSYSVAEFRRDALEHLNQVITKGSIPLLVGGTMLYFKALKEGLAAMPAADSAIRAEIEQVGLKEGWNKVHQQLAEVDPVSASRIHPNDPQRLQRALEVYRISGKTLSQWHADGKTQASKQSGSSDSETDFDLHFFAMAVTDRAHLHKKIAQRFSQMLNSGLVEEVEGLFRRGDLNSAMPAIKSVGYRQVWQYLQGELSYDEMVERGIIATRQLAKRQLTWLRSWENLRVLDKSSAESVAMVLKFTEHATI